MEKRLHIFTPVWGEHFTNLFKNALGRSLQWPKNAESVKNCTWTIFTDSERSKEHLTKAALEIVPTAQLIFHINSRLTEPNAPIGALKMQALLKAIRFCIDNKQPMLMSTPDFIWADGTIENMYTESYDSEGQNLCVSIAHMRALPSLLDPLAELSSFESQKLLYSALEHAHESWTRCEVGTDPNGIYHSGIAWRFVDRKSLITVQHQMPSPFLVHFTESDLKEFERWKGITPPAFGEWDHNWPTKLIEEGRLRYIGSSDVAFMVEITEADKNVPPLNPARRPHDAFFRENSDIEKHLKIQKQFISVFRY